MLVLVLHWCCCWCYTGPGDGVRLAAGVTPGAGVGVTLVAGVAPGAGVGVTLAAGVTPGAGVGVTLVLVLHRQLVLHQC